MKFPSLLLAGALLLSASMARALEASERNSVLQSLVKVDKLVVAGDLREANHTVRSLLQTFDRDRMLAGLCKLAIIYLELGKAKKARVFLARLQLKVVSSSALPRSLLKLSASYLQTKRYTEANAVLEELVEKMPLYQADLAEQVKVIQAMIDLRDEKKALRQMTLLDRKLIQLAKQGSQMRTANRREVISTN